MITKKLLLFTLIIHLLLPGLAYSFSETDITGCHSPKAGDTFTLLCHNVDDIICKNVPDKIRRSCDEKNQTIIHAGMTANEVYNFAKGCLKSAATSFVEFFTEFLPELCKTIWHLTKDVYKSTTSPGFFDSLKGAYESTRSVAVDTYEAIHKDAGAFFANIWNKITEAVGPMVASYDCMNPQTKVEKICGVIAEWVVPPAILAKVIVRGTKAAKELIELGLVAKLGKSAAADAIKAAEALPKLTLKQYHALFKQYKELGYTMEDFKLMKLKGTLETTDIAKLKPLTTVEGMEQYEKLTGKPLKKKEKSNGAKPNKGVDTSLELSDYKKRYRVELKLKPGSNNEFMRLMEEDAKVEGKRIYFDVENSVQKTLNDTVFVDKSAVDAINNSFFEKFNTNLRANKDLMSRLEGEYKDYKSYRLRLVLKPGDDAAKYEQMLADLYKKSNGEFAEDLAKRKIADKIPPRNDGLNTTTGWFLSGAGDSAIDANMAARAARETRNNKMAHFRDHTLKINEELNSIEKLRETLATDKILSAAKIMETTSEGKSIPSKSMLNILRKIKPDDFSTVEEYLAKIREKTKNIFGVTLDNNTLINLTNYFKKVDAISPPMFSPERVLINLERAKFGIVSIDFAGVGVENVYHQMKGLSETELKQSPEICIREGFKRMQDGVDQVTKKMDHAKDTFSDSVSKIEGKKGTPQFSGDDGIHMPLDRKWDEKDKVELVNNLSRSNDPSKFRVTFVETHYPDGSSIPSYERSKRIVRAETLEKDIRAQIIGLEKISDAEAKKFISAIDYAPDSAGGGVFNVIIGGKDFSQKEIDLIQKSIDSALFKEKGEILGHIIINK